MNCGQCGKPAFFKYDNGAYLCVDCNWKVEQAEQMQFERNAAMLNQAYDNCEIISGVSPGRPRIEIPRSTIHAGNTVHNIRVDKSVIGTINTGQIEDMNLALDRVQLGGASELATTLQTLTEAILETSALSQDQKRKATDQLSYIIEQAALPADKRNASISTTILECFERIIGVSSQLLKIWNTVKPIVEKLF